MTKHSELTRIHVPYNWTYADATAREAESGAIPADVGKLARQLDDNTLWMLTDDSPLTWAQVGSSPGTDPNHAYYQYLAASLDPGAIEPLQSGSFSYVVSSSDTKLLLASFATKLGSTGRAEVRDPRHFLALRDVTLAGLGSTSSAVLVDPTLPSYADARNSYFNMLQFLAETSLKQIDIVAPATHYPFLLGAYGGIVVRVVNFDFDWISIQNANASYGLNLANEIQDGASYSQRNDNALTLALNKFVATTLYAGAERTSGVGRGTVIFLLCPSTWSGVTDATSYIFRDDFMGAAIDTATKWTRLETSTGVVQINTLYQWLKLKGTTTWGQNGLISQTSTARANGKVFMCDVFTGTDAAANAGHMVGWHDGAGHSYSDFAHGVLFTGSGGTRILKIYENGNDRGAVGSNWTDNTIYRIRITLGSSNNCTYEIQGGAYGALGSSSWTTLSPSSNSSSTTPLYAGVAAGLGGVMYVSDVKVY